MQGPLPTWTVTLAGPAGVGPDTSLASVPLTSSRVVRPIRAVSFFRRFTPSSTTSTSSVLDVASAFVPRAGPMAVAIARRNLLRLTALRAPAGEWRPRRREGERPLPTPINGVGSAADPALLQLLA